MRSIVNLANKLNLPGVETLPALALQDAHASLDAVVVKRDQFELYRGKIERLLSGEAMECDDFLTAINNALAAGVAIVDEKWFQNSVDAGAFCFPAPHFRLDLDLDASMAKTMSGAFEKEASDDVPPPPVQASVSMVAPPVSELPKAAPAAVPSSGATEYPAATISHLDLVPYNSTNATLLDHHILQCCDFDDNKNKYYCMELHEHHSERGTYVILTRYGRTDDLIAAPMSGRRDMRTFGSLATARSFFDHLYREKTGPVKKYIDVVLRTCKIGTAQLQRRVAGSSETHFDPSQFNAVVDEAVLSLVDELYTEAEKALARTIVAKITVNGVETPLGALHPDQLHLGRDVLDQLGDLLARPQPDPAEVKRLSQRFFSLIPHNLGGRDRAVVMTKAIDSDEKLQEHRNTVQLALDLIQATERMGSAAYGDENKLRKLRYLALRCSMEEVTPGSPEFFQVVNSTPLQNNRVECKVRRVFKLQRQNEPTADTFNATRLLAHGSRACNWYGILSRGLLLPSQVEKLGVRRTNVGWLGAGIYFATTLCTTTRYAAPAGQDGESRFAALVDVRLENPFITTKIDQSLVKAPSGHDGVESRGSQQQGPLDSDFEDNEVCIYDEGRHRMRYLIEFTTSTALPPPHTNVPATAVVQPPVTTSAEAPANLKVPATKRVVSTQFGNPPPAKVAPKKPVPDSNSDDDFPTKPAPRGNPPPAPRIAVKTTAAPNAYSAERFPPTASPPMASPSAEGFVTVRRDEYEKLISSVESLMTQGAEILGRLRHLMTPQTQIPSFGVSPSFSVAAPGVGFGAPQAFGAVPAPSHVAPARSFGLQQAPASSFGAPPAPSFGLQRGFGAPPVPSYDASAQGFGARMPQGWRPAPSPGKFPFPGVKASMINNTAAPVNPATDRGNRNRILTAAVVATQASGLFARGFSRIPAGGVNTPFENTAILEMDDRLRKRFVSERDSITQLDIGLVSVYGEGLPTFVRSGLLEDERLASIILDDDVPPVPPNGVSVASQSEYRNNWEEFTQRQLVGLNWSNVCVAGGCVLACLLSRADNVAPGFRGSDIDVFLYGLSDDDAIAKIKHIIDVVKANRGSNVEVVRTPLAVTIVGTHPYRHIQIVLRMYHSPAEVLLGFDIDACSVGYDGSDVWATPRARRAVNRRINYVNLSRRSLNYEDRLIKYAKRGFAVVLTSDVDLARVNMDSIASARRARHGALKLLQAEAKNRKRSVSASESLRFGGRMRARQRARQRRGKARRERNEARGFIATGRAGRPARADWSLKARDEQGADIQSDYANVLLPWGPQWPAWSVVKFLEKKDKASVFGAGGHDHVAMFGGDVFTGRASWCSQCENAEVPATGVVDYKRVKGPIAFLRENPGTQLMTGSFHPVSDDAFFDGIYDAPRAPK